MPGLHSPEKLAQRRARALARGFLSTSSCHSHSSRHADRQIDNQVSCEERRYIPHSDTNSGDVVFTRDPWKNNDSPPAVATEVDANVPSPPPPPPVVENSLQCGANDRLHASMQSLIEIQNSTIAMLTNEIDVLRRYNYMYGFPSVPYLATWSGDRSSEDESTQSELANLKNEIHGLAKSLPSAVEAAIAKRLPKALGDKVEEMVESMVATSLSEFVSFERFSNLEKLVKELGPAVEHDIAAAHATLRGELSSLDKKCSHSFITIVKKQQQQDDDIAMILADMPKLDCSPHAFLITQCGAWIQKSRNEGTRLQSSDSVDAGDSNSGRLISSTRTEMTTREFLEASTAVKARLPHLAEPVRALLMICDLESNECP